MSLFKSIMICNIKQDKIVFTFYLLSIAMFGELWYNN